VRPADLRCFALEQVSGSSSWKTCDRRASREIGGQHYCSGHAERIEEAVLADKTLVYFAENDGRIKIGISRDPVRRARELNARLLVTEPGGRTREAQLHLLFAHHRIAGEWFRPAPDLLAYIEAISEEAAA
jgi:hypothetical protein